MQFYMYARTAVPVCRDSQINVVGGENRQNIFAFWFPSSYCPVLWPRVCMGMWPASSLSQDESPQMGDRQVWCHMICSIFVVFGGTLLRPTAGAVVLVPKSTTLQNVPWLCATTQEESCAISSWSSTATSAVNTA